ncbi:MAG: MarR family transcriptional regulator [Comamonadaceae bacterium]|nr:MarR family transcriptional regulator [Comamonadaceae bacterium]
MPARKSSRNCCSRSRACRRRREARGDAMLAPLGLSGARGQLLGVIAQAGQPLSVPQIAAAIGVSRQAAQKQLNLLAYDGLVQAQPNPRHLRSPRHALTPAGQRAHAAAATLHDAWAVQLAAEAPTTQLHDALGTLRALHARMADAVPIATGALPAPRTRAANARRPAALEAGPSTAPARLPGGSRHRACRAIPNRNQDDRGSHGKQGQGARPSAAPDAGGLPAGAARHIGRVRPDPPVRRQQCRRHGQLHADLGRPRRRADRRTVGDDRLAGDTRGTRAKAIGALHGGGNVVVLVLFGASWWLRWQQPDRLPDTVAWLVPFCGVAVSLVTAWLGGELVARLGVGVSPNAHLNARSSLDGPAEPPVDPARQRV